MTKKLSREKLLKAKAKAEKRREARKTAHRKKLREEIRKAKLTLQKSKKRLRKVETSLKPPGKRWRNRKHPLGYRARKILERIRSKTTKAEIRTMVQLHKDDEISESEFVNFILSLGLTGQEAYTFWFSPP